MELKGKTVLVVDDEIDLCEIMGAELRDMGASSLSAQRVDHAIRIIASQKIDLVISDIRMPGASGIELLNVIRRTRVDLPVALITGHADISIAEALACGAEVVVSKPFDFDALFELCERLVKPLTQRWMREFQLSSTKVIGEENLSYGRGGFFVKNTDGPLPKTGALFQVTVDRGSRPDKTFEVVCRWARPERKDQPEGWGAEIQAWDAPTAKQGWDHENKVPFIPLK
jgi:CheY-like chemotaxis protein